MRRAKKLLVCLLLADLLNPWCVTVRLMASEPRAPISLQAESAVLLDFDSGRILYAKAAEKRMFPASTTKMLTALLAAEQGQLDRVVTVGDEILLTPQDGSMAELRIGDQITMRDLLYGLMLPSGNDAAYTIAVAVARQSAGNRNLTAAAGVERFVGMMNERAQALGATDSHFVNPDGYHHPNHYSTAHNLALIGREVMRNQFLREVVSCTSYRAPSWKAKGKIEVWENGNHLLDQGNRNYLPCATGLKSGFTPRAGYCLVSSASQSSLNLIGVVLHSNRLGRWQDSRALLDYGLGEFRAVQVTAAGEVVAESRLGRFLSGQVKIVTAAPQKIAMRQSELSRVKREISWADDQFSARDNEVLRLKVPARQGTKVGRLLFQLDGQTLATVPLVVGRMSFWNNWWGKLLTGFGGLSLLIGAVYFLGRH